MNRARSNLALAKNRIPGAYLEDLCFGAQQAAEKAIKAVMIAREIEFPYVHDLGSLLSLLEETGEPVPEAIHAAVSLTTYATTTRYPNAGTPVTEGEYRQAIIIAEAVVRWGEERV
ncbi:MAG: HEPN domain-containing protein [Chromatiales bacterium]|nr:HEPN domain-containing protein [Chromatiales bacterium]